MQSKERLAVLWRHCLILLQCVILVLACTACGAVYSKEPAGDQRVRLDPSLWEGIWIPRYEGAGTAAADFYIFERNLVRQFHIKVADADKGILRVSWVESADGDFRLARSDVYIRRQGHWLLASLPWPGGDGYWWARIEVFPAEKHMSGGSLVIWAPAGRPLLDGIRAGIVPGTIFWSKNTEYLVEVDPEGIAMMQARDDSTGFLWMVPTLYERIKFDDFEPPVSRNPEHRSAPGKDATQNRSP